METLSGCGKRMKKGKSKDYFACLVRFWRDQEAHSWRVTIEDPHTKDKQSFANPNDFWCYLSTILASSDIDHINFKRENDD
jgi:hypothetical protein